MTTSAAQTPARPTEPAKPKHHLLTRAIARQIFDDPQIDRTLAISRIPELCKYTIGAVRVLLEPANFKRLAAAQHQDTSEADVERERLFCLQHAAFITKLHNLYKDECAKNTPAARAAVVLHIAKAPELGSSVCLDELTGYKAYTLTSFGERQFDKMFEMGDGNEVAAIVKEQARTSQAVRDFCVDTMQWQLDSEALEHAERMRA